MAQRKPPNPNTAYGRKRMQQESAQWRENLPDDERRDHEVKGLIFGIVIVAIILGILYLIGGSGAVMDWLKR